MYEILVSCNQHKYSIPNQSEMRTLISLLMKSKKKEEDGENDNDSNKKKDDQFPKEYEEFIIEEIKIAIENNGLDTLLPALLLAAAKAKIKSIIQLNIKHAETKSKFIKRVSSLKSFYKKKQETTRRNKVADGQILPMNRSYQKDSIEF